MFNTGNPLADAVTHGEWVRKCDELAQYQQCCVDGRHYPDKEMVYDADGTNHIAIKNLNEYLADFKQDMEPAEYKKLEADLTNQINNNH